MKRSEYKWKRFKMTWLVPNWRHADFRGPAGWIAYAWEHAKCFWDDACWWCSKNLRPEVSNGYMGRLVGWWKHEAGCKLTPWLDWARLVPVRLSLMSDLKLLDDSWDHKYYRTRDGSNEYFLFEIGMLGNVKVWRYKWVDEHGEAKNAFLAGVEAWLDGKPALLERTDEKLWEGKIRSEYDMLAAVSDMIEAGHFKLSKLELVEFCLEMLLGVNPAVAEQIAKERAEAMFPGKKELWQLDEAEEDALADEMIKEMKNLSTVMEKYYKSLRLQLEPEEDE